MKIGVIGGGTVGRATARAYLEFADEVRVYDHVPERATHPLCDVVACDLVFVCLPEDRIDGFFRPAGYRDRNYVLKSTVPIGTTRRLARQYGLPNLVHSPEFLTARCADADARLPARNLVGYPQGGPGYTNGSLSFGNNQAGDVLCTLYNQRFPGTQVLPMTSDESEAVKLMTNAFFAVKVSLFNEFRALADTLGLDWDTVVAGLLSDGRIAPYHYHVPGPDGRRGFGGACLVKDLETLIRHYVTEGGITTARVCAAALGRNAYDRGGTVETKKPTPEEYDFRTYE